MAAPRRIAHRSTLEEMTFVPEIYVCPGIRHTQGSLIVQRRSQSIG